MFKQCLVVTICLLAGCHAVEQSLESTQQAAIQQRFEELDTNTKKGYRALLLWLLKDMHSTLSNDPQSANRMFDSLEQPNDDCALSLRELVDFGLENISQDRITILGHQAQPLFYDEHFLIAARNPLNFWGVDTQSQFLTVQAELARQALVDPFRIQAMLARELARLHDWQCLQERDSRVRHRIDREARVELVQLQYILSGIEYTPWIADQEAWRQAHPYLRDRISAYNAALSQDRSDKHWKESVGLFQYVDHEIWQAIEYHLPNIQRATRKKILANKINPLHKQLAKHTNPLYQNGLLKAEEIYKTNPEAGISGAGTPTERRAWNAIQSLRGAIPLFEQALWKNEDKESILVKGNSAYNAMLKLRGTLGFYHDYDEYVLARHKNYLLRVDPEPYPLLFSPRQNTPEKSFQRFVQENNFVSGSSDPSDADGLFELRRLIWDRELPVEYVLDANENECRVSFEIPVSHCPDIERVQEVVVNGSEWFEALPNLWTTDTRTEISWGVRPYVDGSNTQRLAFSLFAEPLSGETVSTETLCSEVNQVVAKWSQAMEQAAHQMRASIVASCDSSFKPRGN